MKVEKWWERRPEFLALNPAGEVPVLIEPDGTVLADAGAIAEYLDETYRDKLLIGLNPIDRAETRRLAAWFDVKMNREVTEPLVGEKVMKRLFGIGQPDSAAIRAGQGQSRLSSRLHQLSRRAAALARRRSFLGRRHHRRGASLGARLSRRRAVGRARAGQGMVRAHQVAPALPPDPRRSHSRRAAAQALRRSRFLKRPRLSRPLARRRAETREIVRSRPAASGEPGASSQHRAANRRCAPAASPLRRRMLPRSRCRRDIVGRELQRALGVGARAVEAAELAIGRGAIDERIGAVGSQRQRRVEIVDRALQVLAPRRRPRRGR